MKVKEWKKRKETKPEKPQRYAADDESHQQVKLKRAQGGCLGTKSRRKT